MLTCTLAAATTAQNIGVESEMLFVSTQSFGRILGDVESRVG